MAVRVQCYAGHRGEQTPRRFTLGDRQIEVVEVVDAWLDPDHRYFKVTGDDGFHDLEYRASACRAWGLARRRLGAWPIPEPACSSADTARNGRAVSVHPGVALRGAIPFLCPVPLRVTLR